MRATWRKIAVTAAMAAAVLALAPGARATWPGADGRILFSAYDDLFARGPVAQAADCGGWPAGYVLAVEPDGSRGAALVEGGADPALSPAGALAWIDIGSDCNGYGGHAQYAVMWRRSAGAAGGTRLESLTDVRDAGTGGVAWSRSGAALAFSIGGRLYTADRSGRSVAFLDWARIRPGPPGATWPSPTPAGGARPSTWCCGAAIASWR